MRTEQRIKKKKNMKMLLPYLYIAPMVILLVVFSGWPSVTAVIKSFYRNDGYTVNDFIGLKNYIDILFHDRIFWISMRNLLYLFLGMNVCVCMPVIAAKLTFSLRTDRGRYIVRSLFTVATVVPSVIIMMLWKFIYYPNIGMIARIFEFFGKISPNLLGNEKTAIIAVIMIGFPWVQGLSYLMYFAALQGVDASIIEAAKIDGATNLQIFRKIEIPAISPVFKSLYILAFIGQFQDYERLLILTNGGPNNATMVPGLYMYQTAFNPGNSQYGYACAIAVILFIISFTLSKMLLRERNKD